MDSCIISSSRVTGRMEDSGRMLDIFTDNILGGWRLLNSLMGKWRLSFTLPFYHMDRTILFSLLLCSHQNHCLLFVAQQLINLLQYWKYHLFSKTHKKSFLSLSILISLAFFTKQLVRNEEEDRDIREQSAYIFSYLVLLSACLPPTTSVLCWPSVQPPHSKKEKKSFFPFSSQSKGWTSRRALMCPACPL